jgi:oligopeptide/dipeptide ABC transporter ATP-binding protein
MEDKRGADALHVAAEGEIVPLLEVRDLTVCYELDEGTLTAVDGLNLSIASGETLGLVGESGCGKSAVALALLRAISRPGVITRGEIRFRGQNILDISSDALRELRGGEIAIIYQEPGVALNPVLRVGHQVEEAVRAHSHATHREASARVLELFEGVGIPDARRRVRQYPHELSGGLKQRVMIAMALAGKPSLLIADEPTTALDVTIQAQILDLIADLRRSEGMAVLFITHDFGVVAHIADRLAVMYAGELMEEGSTEQVLTDPRHPYTRALLAAIPSVRDRRTRLAAIAGTLPSPFITREGCAFVDRCPVVTERCVTERPPIRTNDAATRVKCWLA